MNSKSLVIGLAIVLVISLVLVALPLSQPTAEIVAKTVNFKLATMAVCEERGGQNFCEDKLFYKCGDEVKQVAGEIVCDGKTYSFNLDMLGNGTFNSNWSDPRDPGFVGDWVAGK